ncbi:hypothetical protein POUND7_000685 [Theobroma cacao]
MRLKITFLLLLFLLPLALANLTVGFYRSSCPRAESIVRAAVQRRFSRDRSITAALLRMHFHDCFVRAFQTFRAKNMTLNDMVTLLGAHTVGVAHCSFFLDRITSFQGTGRPDPTMDPALVAKLRNVCGVASASNPDPTAFLDQGTSFTVDNQFFKQIRLRRGVMQIDQELANDGLSRLIVSGFASNATLFRTRFAQAMVKMGRIQVLVGKAGEIRRNCRVFNPRRRAF